MFKGKHYLPALSLYLLVLDNSVNMLYNVYVEISKNANSLRKNKVSEEKKWDLL